MPDVRTIRVFLASALLAASALATAWAVWLVATPSDDGGRQAVGTMTLVVAVALLAASAYGLRRL